MSDQFDFTQPDRREPKGFEPPPWEQDAFEELRRRREESAASAVEPDEPVTVEDDDEEPIGFEMIAELGLVDVTEEASEQEPTLPQQGVDDSKLVVMLAGLAAEEPSAQKGLQAVAFSTAAVTGAFGIVLMVWGVVALIRSGDSGRVGVIGGSVFFFFGIAALVFAVWLTVKTLRQQGVL